MATKMNGYTEGRARQNTSPSTQWIDWDLWAVKTYDNPESHTGRKKKILGKQQTTAPKVVTKKVPQHVVDRPPGLRDARTDCNIEGHDEET